MVAIDRQPIPKVRPHTFASTRKASKVRPRGPTVVCFIVLLVGNFDRCANLFAAPVSTLAPFEERCVALKQSKVADLAEAPASISSAKMVAEANGVVAHCHVEGYVLPQVGFELLLPEN
jgi:hypothetical protein